MKLELKAILSAGSLGAGRALPDVLPQLGRDVVIAEANLSLRRFPGSGLAYLTGAPADLDRVKVEITLKDTETGTYVDIPVIPEKISYKEGDQITDDFRIVGLGNVAFPGGAGLDSLSWQSFFPGRQDAGYCRAVEFRKPAEYREWLSGSKDAGTLLQVIIPAWDINKTMTVKSFSWDGQGFEGDIYYSLELQEYRKVEPKEVEVGGTVNDPAQKTPEDRPAVPADEVNDGAGQAGAARLPAGRPAE